MQALEDSVSQLAATFARSQDAVVQSQDRILRSQDMIVTQLAALRDAKLGVSGRGDKVVERDRGRG